MKALICSSPFHFEYAEIDLPVLQQGYSLIKIKRIGICGTDLHAYEGTQPYFSYPRILGHELAAEFVEGDAVGFTPGEPVTFIPYFNCGQCIACRSGKPNCCVQMKVCGVHQDGGMVEYLVVPSSSLIHGEGLSLDQLALIEPLAIGAHGVRRASVQQDEFVLVIGAGPIGLGIIECARIKGGKVIVMDVKEQRLQFCRDHFTGIHTINPIIEDAVSKLNEITNHDMPTVVIDATGNLKAIESGFQYMAHGARYVLVGLQKNDVTFSHPEFHKREATLMSSRNATREDFEFVISNIRSGHLDPLRYITHRVTFKQLKEAFPGWLNPASGVIKAMVDLTG